MEKSQTTDNTAEESKKELLKKRAYSVIDFLIGAFLFGLFLGVVVVFANGTINLLSRWFPGLKKQKEESK